MPIAASTLLLWLAPGLPVAVALAWFVRPLRRFLPGLAALAPLPALALALVHLWVPGEILPAQAPFLVLGFSLGLDLVGGAFLLLVAFLWLAAGVYARAYHRDDPRRAGFFSLWSATLAGNVGVVLAWDLLSFYLAFALLTLAGWGLVVHRRDAEAGRAGRIYIVLALLGEVALLSAILALGAAGGGIFPGFELAGAWEALGDRAPLVAALAVAGFGVKVGLVPLHLWLPLAHPVAPTAASALLSGVMVKAGVLGWMRILPAGGGMGVAPGGGGEGVATVAAGSGVPGALEAILLPGVGEALLFLGVLGAFWGVVCGVAQDDPKAVLAYSTVSQMGYLAVGGGLLLLLPPGDPRAVGALLVYALHHGVAKGALFLSVGVADRGVATGRLGMPWLGLGVAIPALALAGAPLTSGVLAKGVLKEGLGVLGDALEPVLLLAAVGTTLLLLRFWVTLGARVAGAGEEGVATASGGGVASRKGPAEVRVLVGAWGVVVLGSALLPLALRGGIVPLPPGVDLPGVLYQPVQAVLPVVAGLFLGWGAWRQARRVRAEPEKGGLPGRLLSLRIPPGDLVVPAEALVARRPRGAGVLSRAAEGVRAGLLRGEERFLALFERLARHDLVLMRGPLLGVVLAGLVLWVVLLLR